MCLGFTAKVEPRIFVYSLDPRIKAKLKGKSSQNTLPEIKEDYNRFQGFQD